MYAVARPIASIGMVPDERSELPDRRETAICATRVALYVVSGYSGYSGNRRLGSARVGADGSWPSPRLGIADGTSSGRRPKGRSSPAAGRRGRDGSRLRCARGRLRGRWPDAGRILLPACARGVAGECQKRSMRLSIARHKGVLPFAQCHRRIKFRRHGMQSRCSWRGLTGRAAYTGRRARHQRALAPLATRARERKRSRGRRYSEPGDFRLSGARIPVMRT